MGTPPAASGDRQMKGLWLRLYVNVVHNRKVQTLSGETFKFWINLLCITKDLDTDGQVPSVDDIVFQMRTTAKSAEKHLSALKAAGLIDQGKDGDEVHDWNDLQQKSDGDPTARDRKARQRDKDRDITDMSRVTPTVMSRVTENRDQKNVTRTEQSRERERAEERGDARGGRGLSTGSTRPFEVRPGLPTTAGRAALEKELAKIRVVK